MSLGRRKIGIEDASGWVFNRMVDVYSARPAYPPSLVEALVDLAAAVGSRVGDLGAGIGHLALPLAERGFDVVAIEPALAMLERLRLLALERRLSPRSLHAAAERLPLESASLDLVIVADAIHFLDQELAAAEIARVLSPHGALAVITCELADTPFMRQVLAIMDDSAPRRARDVGPAIAQLAAVAKLRRGSELRFYDHTPVDRPTLERILRSISFIGPAMNSTRFAAFIERVHALDEAPIWSRQFTLHAGRRGSARTLRSREELARQADDAAHSPPGPLNMALNRAP